MTLELLSIHDLTIEDEGSFRHIELVGRLKARLKADGVRFAAPAPGSGIDHLAAVSLLNLAFWRPGEVAEILPS